MKSATLLATSVLLFALLAIVAGGESSRTPRYYRDTAPQTADWKRISLAEPHQTVSFTLALKQRNLDVLEQLLEEDSNPKSKLYGKHKTRQEIIELVAPPQEIQDLVINWINSEVSKLGDDHVKKMINNKDHIQMTTTVALAERLFETKFHVFYNTVKKGVVIKHLGELSLPDEISEHVDLVTGITEFPPTDLPFHTRKTEATAGTTNRCNVPYSIKNLYGVPLDLVVNNTQSNIGIYATQSAGTPDGFGLPSLSYYETANGVTQNTVTCIKGNDASGFNPYIDDDLEAHLDVQMTIGMAQGAQICFYLMEYGNGWMYEFANYLFTDEGTPWVISMSYGWIETQQCSTPSIGFLGNCTGNNIPNSATYIQRTNVEFQKLGLLGHTLLAASGDDGTSGTHSSSDFCKTLGPIYPAASPWVTAVGATSVEDSSVSNSATIRSSPPPICTQSSYYCACSTSSYEQPALSSNTASFDTGGGFSHFSAMPSYQADAVNAYLSSGVTLPSSTLFNSSNRAFPDIGAVGENICLLETSGGCEFVGGTSASTPLIASLVTLLNQDRLNAGKTTLGFINPIIYDMYAQAASTYYNTQFTSGNNKGSCAPDHGYNANPQGGWNPLVGVGSPRFAAIRQYVASLP